MKLKIGYKNGKPYITGVSCSELARNKALAFFVKTLMPNYKCEGNNGPQPPQKLITPVFNLPSINTTSFSLSVINKPLSASIIWSLNGVVQVGETGTTFAPTGLTANTPYTITAKYIQSGWEDSDVRTTNITTSQIKLITPTLGTTTIGETTLVLPTTNRPASTSSVWLVNGVVQPTQTGATLNLSGLTHNTTYNIQVRYTREGYLDSDTVSTSITTTQTKLVTPTFGLPTVTQNSITQSVTNRPTGASTVWLLNGVIQTGQTGTSITINGLTANTEYTLIARYTRSGYITSNDATTNVTTSQSKLVTPTLNTPTITENSIEITATNRPVGSTIVWVVDGVNQLETSNTLLLEELDPNTDYDITVRYTQSGYISSDITSITVTTEEDTSDPNLVNGAIYRDEFTQTGEGAEPRNAVDHIFNMTTVSFGASLFLPNLALAPNVDGEIIFHMIGPNAPTVSFETHNLKSREGDNYVLWMDGNSIQYYPGTGPLNLGTLGSDELIAVHRTTSNILNIVKYDANKNRTIIYSGSTLINPTSNYYPKWFDSNGATIKYLQYKNAIIVDNNGDPIDNGGGNVSKEQLNSFNNSSFYANEATTVGNVPLTDGAIIATINDAIGNNDLNYAGLSSPSRGRPYYWKGAIVFENVAETYFSSGSGSYNNSFEFSIVARYRPGQGYEAVLSVPYFGLIDLDYNRNGGGQFRVLNHANGWIEGIGGPKPLEVNIIHVKVEVIGGNKANVQCWMNGLEAGTKTNIDYYGRTNFAVGVSTNSADFDFIYHSIRESIASDSQRNDYLQNLNDFFNAGEMPSEPYASNITCIKSGNQYTTTYTYNGVNPQNVGATIIDWWELDPDGGFKQTKLSNPTNSNVFNYSGGKAIRPSITVYDNQGNFYRDINYRGWV